MTFILRLLPDRLARGELVGEVEHVGDGEQAYVNGLQDLLSFARDAGAAELRPSVQRAAAGDEPEEEAGEDTQR